MMAQVIRYPSTPALPGHDWWPPARVSGYRASGSAGAGYWRLNPGPIENRGISPGKNACSHLDFGLARLDASHFSCLLPAQTPASHKPG